MFVVYTLLHDGRRMVEAEFNSREEAEQWVKKYELVQWDGEEFEISEE